ncbi:FAD-dependent 5-carboxymethylaminomethyl-2-thiouridine(34) oxidoreductase MnmC [Ideonella sp. YS5]|uniref:FAD-dependent 5-carboxymethylaminomethyl-2-thiouridine(34) oxidoreductase MnmC n=1 Tax=Ideonella sp. YS5 TaxID=3453714 RepID=UPI003EEBA44C
MKSSGIVPARIEIQDGVPFAPEFGDVYHARAGAFEQAREVFLAGNGLPARWRGRERFVVLETGFGLGNNFLATWAAWRNDPARPKRLVFVSIEKHPPTAADLTLLHANSPEPLLAKQLLAAWPAPTHAIHSLEFDGGQVSLLLAMGDVASWLPELQLQADAFYLDGFAPARNAPMWDARVLRALGRLSAPGATAATWSVARGVRDGLASAGFNVRRAAGFAGKRQMTVAEADAGVSARRRAAPPGRQTRPDARTAVVIGAGLAGASAAWALARQGLQVTVLEAAGHPAAGASGNPAGLFHGVVHSHDGAHAQWLRAAALRAKQAYGPLVDAGLVPGAVNGLLRGAGTATLATLRTTVGHQALPASYVKSLSREEASAAAGVPVAGPAWLFPGGGWLRPGALVEHWLDQAGVTLRCGTPVSRLDPLPGGRWRACVQDGNAPVEADVAVVATAAASHALLEPHSDAAEWPWRRTRGQVTCIQGWQAAALPHPRLPLASGGYLIALPQSLGGGVLCGATSDQDDGEPGLREADHRRNLAQVAALTGLEIDVDSIDIGALSGRVGWRLGLDDRLPVVGAVPLRADGLIGVAGLEQARHVPRVAGLYVLAGLGSRGITWAALMGEVLAATIVGAPVPVAGSLLDAVDPARFLVRGRRRPAR